MCWDDKAEEAEEIYIIAVKIGRRVLSLKDMRIL